MWIKWTELDKFKSRKKKFEIIRASVVIFPEFWESCLTIVKILKSPKELTSETEGLYYSVSWYYWYQGLKSIAGTFSLFLGQSIVTSFGMTCGERKYHHFRTNPRVSGYWYVGLLLSYRHNRFLLTEREKWAEIQSAKWAQLPIALQ